jgi:hypothetical protein
MNSGKSIFAQLMDFLPSKAFRRCVKRYQGDYKLKSFSCWDQFLCMAFAQLTFRESLRDIEACLRAQQTKLYHLGIRGQVSRNTLANANSVRDWRIYADFAQVLITRARALYANDSFGVELAQTVYALDATTIDLCLALFPWAKFRRHKGAVKLHTLLDLRGNIPTVVIITHGKVHEVNILDQLSFEAGAFYVMDRGYLDFARLYTRQKALRFPAPLFTTSGSSDGRDLRSDSDARQSCPSPRLSREATSHSLLRCPKAKTTGLSHQQLQLATPDYCRAVSQPLASRIVFQMDQTTPAHQEFLRHFRERLAYSNLDRDLGLCARGYRQKGIAPAGQSLQNVTDLQRHTFRENPHFTGSFFNRRSNRLGPFAQTTDSIQLTLGQY